MYDNLQKFKSVGLFVMMMMIITIIINNNIIITITEKYLKIPITLNIPTT